MTTSPEEQAFAALESRLKAILPKEYQERYNDVKPVSMGSASLKFGADGRVAWDEIWGSFCDLAMAGGPPHKGSLLEPGTTSEISKQPEQYQQVVEEITRGIRMATVLPARTSPHAGWVAVECENEAMSGWLMRAIVMENVSACCDGKVLLLPAGPAYRLEKEIKNVITSIAKTSHYWIDHMWSAQQQKIAQLFEKMATELPLQQPARADDPGFHAGTQESLSHTLAAAIQQKTGLCSSTHSYTGWLGLECKDVRPAVWMMRALVASNVLSRREGTVLFVPVNTALDPQGDAVVQRIMEIHRMARAQGVLSIP